MVDNTSDGLAGGKAQGEELHCRGDEGAAVPFGLMDGAFAAASAWTAGASARNVCEQFWKHRMRTSGVKETDLTKHFALSAALLSLRSFN